MNSGIHITDRAEQHLKNILAARDKGPDQCLRLVTMPGGQLGLVLSKKRKQDQPVVAEVLFIDPALAAILEGSVLDWQDAPEGSRLCLLY